MGIPTIITAGTNNGLLLITDQSGNIHRVPKANVCNIYDSSNENVSRLDICYPSGEIILIFENASQVATAISEIDALY